MSKINKLASYIAAVPKELVGLGMAADGERDRPVDLAKGARQGACGAPILWHCLVSAFTEPVAEKWEGEFTVECCQADQP